VCCRYSSNPRSGGRRDSGSCREYGGGDVAPAPGGRARARDGMLPRRGTAVRVRAGAILVRGTGPGVKGFRTPGGSGTGTAAARARRGRRRDGAGDGSASFGIALVYLGRAPRRLTQPSDPPPQGPPATGLARSRHAGRLPRGELRRAGYALAALAVCEILGTVGFHLLEGFTWVDSFYEESMLATGQGPAIGLVHDSSKVFASVMGFISLGSTLTTIVFALAPVVARIWHEARVAAARDARLLEEDLARGLTEVRDDLHGGSGPP
jgi:hypothetical protein